MNAATHFYDALSVRRNLVYELNSLRTKKGRQIGFNFFPLVCHLVRANPISGERMIYAIILKYFRGSFDHFLEWEVATKINYLVANTWPTESLMCTMSKDPACRSRETIVPTRPKLRPPVIMHKFPSNKIIHLVSILPFNYFNSIF